MDAKQEIRRIWGFAAQEYDQSPGHGVQTEAEKIAWLSLLRRLLPPDKPLEVLDVGTGTGVLAFLIAELGHKVTGIDITPAMLEQARAKAGSAGPVFLEGDADSPPFPAGSFDAVVCRHLLWTLPEPERAVRAWRRVAKPGGLVMAIDGYHRWTPVTRGVAAAWSFADRLRRAERHEYPASLTATLALDRISSLEAPRNVFLRAGLSNVLAEELPAITAAVDAALPRSERLRHPSWRNYLVEGRA